LIRYTEGRYINNCSFLKQYNKNKYKLVTLKKSIRVAGYEEEKDTLYDADNTRNKNEEKLENNIIRAKSRVLEYALCNDFEYFVTGFLNMLYAMTLNTL